MNNESLSDIVTVPLVLDDQSLYELAIIKKVEERLDEHAIAPGASTNINNLLLGIGNIGLKNYLKDTDNAYKYEQILLRHPDPRRAVDFQQIDKFNHKVLPSLQPNEKYHKWKVALKKIVLWEPVWDIEKSSEEYRQTLTDKKRPLLFCDVVKSLLKLGTNDYRHDPWRSRLFQKEEEAIKRQPSNNFSSTHSTHLQLIKNTDQ